MCGAPYTFFGNCHFLNGVICTGNVLVQHENNSDTCTFLILIYKMNQKQAAAIRTPITYYGGKQNLVGAILPLIPLHNCYVEPFFGGGAIFWAKQPSQVEVINDLNQFVINFYRIAKNEFNALQELISATPLSRICYKDAQIMYDNPHLFSDLQKAWAFWVLTNQGFVGKIGSWGYGTKDNKRELNIANKRLQFKNKFSERLELVQMECSDANRIIKLRDRVDTFFYCDPPYVGSNQGHYGGYTDEHFGELLTSLSNVQGKFLLSSFPNELLNQFTKQFGWHTIEIEMPCSSSKDRKIKKEVLTANYDINAMRNNAHAVSDV
jgi:DNA adenine methylase